MISPTIVVHPPASPGIPSNRFSSLIPDQSIAVLDHFTLQSGITLRNVQVGFRTWGVLNHRKDNVMIICHALTGSSDVEDWWGPLLGPRAAFDPTRYFIFCANVLGSPYGTSSPVTINPETGLRYGPEFPATVVRDDVRLQKLLLDHLGVQSVAVVIGGSMGGMSVLEYPLTLPPSYIRNIIPIATSSRHSAWGISWGEAQRQSIYSDPDYLNGWYGVNEGEGPRRGLAAARMAALLTYRSRDSFESRFGRKEVDSEGEGSGEGGKVKGKKGLGRGKMYDGWGTPRTQAERAEAAHNDGHRSRSISPTTDLTPSLDASVSLNTHLQPNGEPQPPPEPSTIFSAQSYLRYQGDKFVNRFDANCYIHLTRKMDSHDILRGRLPPLDLSQPQIEKSEEEIARQILSAIPSGALIIAISSDGLFTLSEQRELSQLLPQAQLIIVDSPDGHDGFLLEFEEINRAVLGFLKARLGNIYEGERLVAFDEGGEMGEGIGKSKASLFGEAEGDVTRW